MVRVGRSCRSNEIIFFLDESEDFFITFASYFNSCVSENKGVLFFVGIRLLKSIA